MIAENILCFLILIDISFTMLVEKKVLTFFFLNLIIFRNFGFLSESILFFTNFIQVSLIYLEVFYA